MKIAIHSFAFNFSDQPPVKPLIDKIKERGHEVVFLDTDKAVIQNGVLVFPELGPSASIDCFISYLPSCDMEELKHGKNEDDVPYFEQVSILSSRFASATPYASQMITNDKANMAKVFCDAGVSIPMTIDPSARWGRENILSYVAAGGKMVFKPCFGGNSVGIVRVNTAAEALEAFKSFDDSSLRFIAQEYIDLLHENGTCADYRAFVVGDQVVAGIKCTMAPEQWKRGYVETEQGIFEGTTDEPYDFTDEQKRDVVTALQASGLAFGSVDILIDPKTGQHYICEINDNLSLSDIVDDLGDVDLAHEIVDMLEEKYGHHRGLALEHCEL